MVFPEKLGTRSVRCKGQEFELEVFEPWSDVRSVSIQGGQCFLRVCDFKVMKGPHDNLVVGIEAPDARMTNEQLVWWLPRAGFLAVIDVLCGRLAPWLENTVLLRPLNPTDDPQKANMSFFRRRCRYDVLRVINQCLLDAAGPGQLDTKRLSGSTLLSRIYSDDDLVEGMQFWAKEQILVNAVFGPMYSIDTTMDDEVRRLLDDYDWEECPTTAAKADADSAEGRESGSDSERNPTQAEPGPQVFVCHAKQDAQTAEKFYDVLAAVGADPWLDKKNLIHGDDWEREINKAVAAADVFVVCLRPGFDDVGYRQKEVRLALEALKLRPPGRGFIIPFIVEPCPLPDWCGPIHAGSDLTQRTTVEELLQAVEKHCQWTRTGKT